MHAWPVSDSSTWRALCRSVPWELPYRRPALQSVASAFPLVAGYPKVVSGLPGRLTLRRNRWGQVGVKEWNGHAGGEAESDLRRFALGLGNAVADSTRNAGGTQSGLELRAPNPRMTRSPVAASFRPCSSTLVPISASTGRSGALPGSPAPPGAGRPAAVARHAIRSAHTCVSRPSPSPSPVRSCAAPGPQQTGSPGSPGRTTGRHGLRGRRRSRGGGGALPLGTADADSGLTPGRPPSRARRRAGVHRPGQSP